MRTPSAALRLLLTILPVLPAAAAAQVARDSSVDWLVSAGSEVERYLRTMQVAGLEAGEPMQWSLRPFSAARAGELARSADPNPWTERLGVRPVSRVWFTVVQPDMGGIINSSFPYGFNDGPVWAGRGLTVVVSGGVQGALGPLEFMIAPQFFRAQNASFPLAPTSRTGLQAFGDARGGNIDLPQRFGAAAYQRLDPGQSVVRLTARRVTIGVSSANEIWGPASESPFLLSNNAAGFPHLFAGTDGPLSLGPFRIGVRLIAGRLDQSAYSPAPSENGRRYLTGLALVGGFTGIPGLEVGVGRLFENVWPDSGLAIRDILEPLTKNPFKARLPNGGGGPAQQDNQLGSIFARWVFPRSGVEVYGEVGREDNAADLRDLILEPDHDLAFMVGMQRVFKRQRGALLVLRGELLNSSISHLARVREQAAPYEHTVILQGHTQLGQVLGAASAYGGGGASAAVDWIEASGRTTVTWRRANREPPPSTAFPRDVLHSLTVERLLFRARMDIAPEAALIYNANRNGRAGALNARVALTARAHW